MEGPANTAAPEADPSLLLNTMALNVKVCRELLQQTRVSLDCVEARLGPGHGARSVSRPASHTAAGQALGPSSARYSLFRGLPEDSEWAQLLERQLCTRTFELLPTEQLAEALSFLTETEESHHYQSAEGPQHQSAEGPQHQSAKGPQHQSEGPTLYQSALELSRSDSTQELQPRGGAHMEEDLSDNGESDGNSEEGPLSPPTPSLGLLHMELELSSISHSPHQHKMLNVLFKRHLAPCNSTPRNTGVQPIFESRPLVNSLSASQSFCTAVDEPADHSEGDVYADTKKTQEVLLFGI
ncbi:uncharacterized protein [Eucyclogobius newberryi]|uniref:uncharacterized protein n=1 Tax=Eucyclogobius newberryi TaxID=166745 RepID=UPI003B5AF5CE